MNSKTAKNLVVFAGSLSLGIATAAMADYFMSQRALADLLKEIWVVQAVLVAAVVSLIYRLQSDIASLTGLKSVQRAELDRLVRVKSTRLWILFFAIALATLLPRIGASLPGARGALNQTAVVISVMSAIYCLYLPAMWNELRKFLTGMVAERERKQRLEDELKRLDSAAERGKVRQDA